MTDWDEETLARAAGMKRAGMPMRVIAERLGATPAQVKARLLKAKAYRRLDHAGGPGGLPPRLTRSFVDTQE